MSSVESNIRKLDRQIQLFESQLSDIVDEVLIGIERDINRGEINPDILIQKTSGIVAKLNRAGLSKFIDVVAQTYGTIINDVSSAFSFLNIAFSFTSKDETDLAAVIDVDVSEINLAANRFAGNLSSRLVRASLPGEPLDLIGIFKQAKAMFIRDVLTILENALQGVRNAFYVRKGKEAGIEKFLYSGPRDQKNREFCAQRVGQVFTLAEINRMDNGQGLPVLTNCGGWNCRHEFRPFKN